MARRKRGTRKWVDEKKRDPYARQARQSGYRSRSAYKLEQIDRQDGLLRGARRVLDVGAAPGGWSQYAKRRITGGSVVAVDLLAMTPIEGVTIIQGDFTDSAVQARLLEAVEPGSYDLVISDMAPNITGIVDVDQARGAELAEQVINFSARILADKGRLLVKVFEGSEAARIRTLGQSLFQRSVVRKPDASKDKSREFYLVLQQPRR